MATLRAILLLEADFNGMNKITRNSRVFPRLDVCRVISYEVIGGKRIKSSQHVSFNKKLVGNQTRHPTVFISADATSLSDRIEHLVTSMKNQYFGVQL